jgi:hypothetical protein
MSRVERQKIIKGGALKNGSQWVKEPFSIEIQEIEGAYRYGRRKHKQ